MTLFKRFCCDGFIEPVTLMLTGALVTTVLGTLLGVTILQRSTENRSQAAAGDLCEAEGGRCYPDSYSCRNRMPGADDCRSGYQCAEGPCTAPPGATNTPAPQRYACNRNGDCVSNSSGFFRDRATCEANCEPDPGVTPVPTASNTPRPTATPTRRPSATLTPSRTPTPAPGSRCDNQYAGKCVPLAHVCSPTTTYAADCLTNYKCVTETASCHAPYTPTPTRRPSATPTRRPTATPTRRPPSLTPTLLPCPSSGGYSCLTPTTCTSEGGRQITSYRCTTSTICCLVSVASPTPRSGVPTATPRPGTNCQDRFAGICVSRSLTCTPATVYSADCGSNEKCVPEAANCRYVPPAPTRTPTRLPTRTPTSRSQPSISPTPPGVLCPIADSRYQCLTSLGCQMDGGRVFTGYRCSNPASVCCLSGTLEPSPTPVTLASGNSCDEQGGTLCGPKNLTRCAGNSELTRYSTTSQRCCASTCLRLSPTPVPTLACQGTCIPSGETCSSRGNGYCPGSSICCATLPTAAPVIYPTPSGATACEQNDGILCLRSNSTCNAPLSRYNTSTAVCCLAPCAYLCQAGSKNCVAGNTVVQTCTENRHWEYTQCPTNSHCSSDTKTCLSDPTPTPAFPMAQPPTALYDPLAAMVPTQVFGGTLGDPSTSPYAQGTSLDFSGSCYSLNSPDLIAACLEANRTETTLAAAMLAAPAAYFGGQAAYGAATSIWSTASLGGTAGLATTLTSLPTASYIYLANNPTAPQALSTLSTIDSGLDITQCALTRDPMICGSLGGYGLPEFGAVADVITGIRGSFPSLWNDYQSLSRLPDAGNPAGWTLGNTSDYSIPQYPLYQMDPATDFIEEIGLSASEVGSSANVYLTNIEVNGKPTLAAAKIFKPAVYDAPGMLPQNVLVYEELTQTRILEELGVGAILYGQVELPDGRAGILTEYIPGTQDPPLEWINSQVVNEMQRLTDTLTGSGYILTDPQWLVTNDGMVKFIDAGSLKTHADWVNQNSFIVDRNFTQLVYKPERGNALLQFELENMQNRIDIYRQNTRE